MQFHRSIDWKDLIVEGYHYQCRERNLETGLQVGDPRLVHGLRMQPDSHLRGNVLIESM